MMDYNLLDDQVLDLAYRQATTDHQAQNTVESYKIYARLKYQVGIRRSRRAVSRDISANIAELINMEGVSSHDALGR